MYSNKAIKTFFFFFMMLHIEDSFILSILITLVCDFLFPNWEFHKGSTLQLLFHIVFVLLLGCWWWNLGCLCVYMIVCPCEDQRLTPGVFLSTLPLKVLKQNFSLNVELMDGSLLSVCSHLLPVLELQICATTPGFFYGYWVDRSLCLHRKSFTDLVMFSDP